MSAQTVTDTDVQQTDVRGFLRKMRKGEPLNTEATTRLFNRIYNILEGLAGEGCVVEKPLYREGLGWRIVVDGSHSDTEPMGRVPMPFELIHTGGAWHIWLRDAEVVMNNYHAHRANSLLLDESSSYTAMSFGADANVYLYVTAVKVNGVLHGQESYIWDIGVTVPTGALAYIVLGRVESATRAIQYQRGNQILYSLADSEIIKLDSANAEAHVDVPTDNLDGPIPPPSTIPTIDDHLALVVRHGGGIQYYKLTDLLAVAFSGVVDIISDPDGPIGNKTWEEWESQLEDIAFESLQDLGWVFQPRFSDEDLDGSEYYGGGIGSASVRSAWVGITDEMLEELNLPPRSNLDQALDKLAEVREVFDAINTDPDGDGPQRTKVAELSAKLTQLESAADSAISDLVDLESLASAIGAKLQSAQALASQNETRFTQLEARRDAIELDVEALEDLVAGAGGGA